MAFWAPRVDENRCPGAARVSKRLPEGATHIAAPGNRSLRGCERMSRLVRVRIEAPSGALLNLAQSFRAGYWQRERVGKEAADAQQPSPKGLG